MWPLYMYLLLFNIEFPKKLNFPEGMGGGLIIFVENLEGRGVTVFLKKWKIQGGGGSLVNFPPWWRYGYFLGPHIVLSM